LRFLRASLTNLKAREWTLPSQQRADSRLGDFGMTALQRENEELRSEIFNLFKYIQSLRTEIVQINSHTDDRTHFQTMSEHLDEIVSSTEQATDSILEKLEAIDSFVDEIRNSGANGKVPKICDRISETTMAAVESCTFQDITGQRVNRVVKSMQFVEERVSAMVDLWGRDNIEALREEFGDLDTRTGDEALLNGPQLAGESISQDEIDKLFA
jgi:chemotaxis protein CheZ